MTYNGNWKRTEELRKTANCITCNRLIKIKAKGNCQNCWHKIKKQFSPKFYLTTKYTQIKQRCQNEHNCSYERYKNFNICTKEEFLNKFLKDKKFLLLHKKWIKSGLAYALNPSVDRIDVTKGYTIDNIQIITHSENATKDQVKNAVKAFKFKTKEYIGTYISENEAARQLKVQHSNLWKVLNGRRKHTGGYTFEYA